MKGIVEKLGITTRQWSFKPFTYAWESKVSTYEVHHGPDGECVAGSVAVMEDARLIAAAPEMLDALMQRANAIDRKGGDHMTLNEELEFTHISGIIEKATGKTWEEIKELL